MARLDTWKWRDPPHDGSRPLGELPCKIDGCEAPPQWVVSDDVPYNDVACSRHLYSVLAQWSTQEFYMHVRPLTKADKAPVKEPVVQVGYFCTQCGGHDHTSASCTNDPAH